MRLIIVTFDCSDKFSTHGEQAWETRGERVVRTPGRISGEGRDSDRRRRRPVRSRHRRGARSSWRASAFHVVPSFSAYVAILVSRPFSPQEQSSAARNGRGLPPSRPGVHAPPENISIGLTRGDCGDYQLNLGRVLPPARVTTLSPSRLSSCSVVPVAATVVERAFTRVDEAGVLLHWESRQCNPSRP
jgi:hypothetical protein